MNGTLQLHFVLKKSYVILNVKIHQALYLFKDNFFFFFSCNIFFLTTRIIRHDPHWKGNTSIYLFPNRVIKAIQFHIDFRETISSLDSISGFKSFKYMFCGYTANSKSWFNVIMARCTLSSCYCYCMLMYIRFSILGIYSDYYIFTKI